MKRNLTDRALKALKPAPAGERRELWDAVVPGLGVRVTDRGRVSFVLLKRLDGKLKRWTLGEYVPQEGQRREASPAFGAAHTLAEARDLARGALQDIARGVDPMARQEERRREEERRRQDTFGAVARTFLERHARRLRSGARYAAVIERHFMPAWGGRPVAEITRRDVIAALEGIADRSGPAAAHQAVSILKALFGWALSRDFYGLDRSPCDRIDAGKVIGKREPRQRALDDNELRLAWQAAGQAGYPYGPLVKLLIISGVRLREAANARWPEFDPDQARWVIPATRMKGGLVHEVPLPPLAGQLLRSLPRFAGDGCVFTTTGGAKPVNGFSEAKKRLDGLMVELMRGEAKDPAKVRLEPWTFHDLRRTMRSHLSALPVQDLVRELAIAHRRPGMHKVYDRHEYREELRRCFELWAARLISIVEPPPANVVPLHAGERA